MVLSPEQRKLLQQALGIRGSQVPLHRIIDVLATPDGDISSVINRFRDIKDPDLRRSLHNCAVLLRELEKEAGLQPAWERPQASQDDSPKPIPAANPAGSKSAMPAAPKPVKPKYRTEDLRTYEDENWRGKVRMAKMFIDGASKGNPGDAGIGVALVNMEGQTIAQLSESIGKATNNIAEYTALTEGLELAKRMGVRVVHVISDSELLVKQMTGKYKIKNPDILQKVKLAHSRMKEFEKCGMSWVNRENNTLADALSTAQLKKPSEPKGLVEGDVMEPLNDFLDEGSTE